MKRGAADLNLLLIFEAVLESRSVSKAADRLGMSQSALSHALGRLRITLKDELFVRSPAGMIPTPRAEALAWPVRQALAGLEEILEPEIFEPATSDRHFNIAVNNYSAIVLAAGIAVQCAVMAPHVRLAMRPSGTLNLVSLMDRGEVDLVLSSPTQNNERIRSKLILTDDYVVVTRANHPTRGRRLDIRTIATTPNLSISSSLDDMGFIEDALEEHGLKRTIALEAPYLTAGSIIDQSNLMAILARNVANNLAESCAIEIRDLPFPSNSISTAMRWARRYDDQPAHLWLRALVASIAVSLRSTATGLPGGPPTRRQQ